MFLGGDVYRRSYSRIQQTYGYNRKDLLQLTSETFNFPINILQNICPSFIISRYMELILKTPES
jgi:hypothetical protein